MANGTGFVIENHVDEREFRVGLVLHMDPDTLEAEGAYGHLLGGEKTISTRVHGPHYFLCVGTDGRGRHSYWAPLFSRDRGHRLRIPNEMKVGPYQWRQTTTHLDERQMWSAKWFAIEMACRFGRDLSLPSRRCYVQERGIPREILALVPKVRRYVTLGVM